MDYVRFGFAAGGEAVATPRRRGAFTFLGYALGAAWPDKSEGLSPNQGHSPRVIWLLSAGHSHRREANSGGKAEAASRLHHDLHLKLESHVNHRSRDRRLLGWYFTRVADS